MTDSNDKIVDIWQRSINPLHNLTQYQIESMLDFARRGNDVILQQCYYIIEQTMPIFGICIDKRQSQLLDLKWHVEGEDEASAKRIDDIFRRNETEEEFDNISNAIEHLSLYAFRGRSSVKPFFDNGKLIIKTLNNWNVLQADNKLYWNPSSAPAVDMSSLQQIPDDEIIFCTSQRPIDLPGILIYLRQLVGETKWAQFVERQGIPQVIITAPEGTPDSALPMWTMRAQQIMNGGSGVVSPGSSIQELTAARGQDPFSAFCQHQMELIAILATGGTLATIGGATGLGSNLADVQNDQFLKLVRRDMRKIEHAMSRMVKYVAAKLGIADETLKFVFDIDKDETREVLETAKALKDMGVPVDIEKMKKLVKHDIFAESSSELWTPDGDNKGIE